jgi:hypothetical protein
MYKIFHRGMFFRGVSKTCVLEKSSIVIPERSTIRYKNIISYHTTPKSFRYKESSEDSNIDVDDVEEIEAAPGKKLKTPDQIKKLEEKRKERAAKKKETRLKQIETWKKREEKEKKKKNNPSSYSKQKAMREGLDIDD